MNAFNYLDTAPAVLLVVFGIVAPHLSALLTRAPGYVAGALTLLFSALDGFLIQWANQGHGYDIKHGLLDTLTAWAVALGTQYGILRTTGMADRLHDKGPQLGDGPVLVRSKRAVGAPRLAGDTGQVATALVVVLLVLIVLFLFGGFFVAKWLFILLVIAVIVLAALWVSGHRRL
jgi:hypothetical protein